MGHSGSAQSNQFSAAEARSLQAAYAVCIEAQQFFRRAAQQVANSNLRYKFLQLANLHLAAAQRLAKTCGEAETAPDYRSELAAVQFWYLHQAAALSEQALQQQMLAELAAVLQQQIRGLRQLAGELHSRLIRVELAQLVADLQISNDQLQPLLKELQAARQCGKRPGGGDSEKHH